MKKTPKKSQICTCIFLYSRCKSITKCERNHEVAMGACGLMRGRLLCNMLVCVTFARDASHVQLTLRGVAATTTKVLLRFKTKLGRTAPEGSINPTIVSLCTYFNTSKYVARQKSRQNETKLIDGFKRLCTLTNGWPPSKRFYLWEDKNHNANDEIARLAYWGHHRGVRQRHHGGPTR